ncbi:hypothetical protein D9756_006505 [Leucocoprinus leucothites]|uniref:Uncharacterized protein n=1 Tax=Leucocoprinus leucothites TaxID=201217 RepID=A0A8H5G2C1_9AGAR|nr:hypothetical protein D9756_006505 [Leucoagaricus leucothites]
MSHSQKPSEPVGQLFPTFTSQENSRYKNSKRTKCTSFAIELGTRASPTYLPPHWSTHVQPEGKPYFYHRGELAIVTESWLYTPEIATEAAKWVDHLTVKIKEKGVDLANTELYIRIDEDLDCLYYGVDKRDRTLFWIDDYETEQLGLPPVASPSHLRTLLELHYWEHVDRFPAHFGGLPEATLLKLQDIFTHCRMDHITSSSAAFTYSQMDTLALSKVLKDCRGRTQEPEIVSTVARIWHLVLYNRFHNHYGEENPRLDVSMAIFEDQSPESPGFQRVFSYLSFGKSQKYRTKLNSLYVDKYIYSHRVDAFVNGLLKEWKEQYLPSFFMLLLHAAFFQLIASQTVAAISAACFSASLLSAFALVQQHEGLIEYRNSPVAIDWLSDRASTTYKFQRLSLALALPNAFFNWGLVFFFGHWLFIALSRLDTNVAATFVGIIGLAIFAFIIVTSPNTIPTISFPRLPRSCRSKCSPEDESMV